MLVKVKISFHTILFIIVYHAFSCLCTTLSLSAKPKSRYSNRDSLRAALQATISPAHGLAESINSNLGSSSLCKYSVKPCSWHTNEERVRSSLAEPTITDIALTSTIRSLLEPGAIGLSLFNLIFFFFIVSHTFSYL